MRLRVHILLPLLAVAASSVAACNDNPSGGGQPLTTISKPSDKPGDKTTPMPPGPATPPPADQGAKPASGELTWDTPASFKKVANPSAMRKATFEAPKVGSDAEAPTMSVIVAGGGVDANIDRWVGQFDESAKETLQKDKKTVGPYEVTIVQMKGTFSGGGGMMGAPSTPQTGWALLGAVVVVGQDLWFFKMTGPAASVDAARADFDKLVDSLHPAP